MYPLVLSVTVSPISPLLSLSSTQESGNLMTERNLAMIIGPNILHKELKVHLVTSLRCTPILLYMI